ncbi:MAG: hypothetical protein GY873_41110 [Bosea sp.]|jgi:hypothetical protein|uniref:hypothetical protein n=1 Tax=Bosea sp. (in: a-proteobacteria) TaxID=1871050 RepID=UPI00239274C2|nr:hypothetical protein [Bosea sp. (in: a-proteobacteria)]MDG2028018.1 hypothetical protein [Acidimicrobiales bacterium]
MAYDPQANRRRPRPDDDAPAPVDAILGEAPTAVGADWAPGDGSPVADDPPPTPAVTPEPADPPSDQLLLTSGVATAIGGLIALLTLRHLWVRHRRRRAAAEVEPD